LLVITCMGISGCQLRRPKVPPARVIEPQLLDPQLAEPDTQVAKSPNAAVVRVLDTQALGDIGRTVLHQQSGGELTADSSWHWSARPEQYLDLAIHLEAARRSDLRLVDSGHAPTLAPKLLVWDLESSGGTQLVGAVEFQITGTGGVLTTKVVRSSEPASAELPGDLAAASGRLLHRLASEGLTLAVSKQ
jgi:hypothetical protein